MFSPIPDQKSQRIAEILMQEVVSLFGIPENLLSDRGAQGAHDEHMQASGIHKLNTTTYHPQCNGIVERVNRTFEGCTEKACSRVGIQWDKTCPEFYGPKE